MKNQRIEKKDLREEIALLLKDHFVAEILRKSDELHIRFLNGQKFCVLIKEM